MALSSIYTSTIQHCSEHLDSSPNLAQNAQHQVRPNPASNIAQNNPVTLSLTSSDHARGPRVCFARFLFFWGRRQALATKFQSFATFARL